MGILTSIYHILNSENDSNKNFEELKHSKSYSVILYIPYLFYSTIFKTFQSELDGISNKIGFNKKVLQNGASKYLLHLRNLRML